MFWTLNKTPIASVSDTSSDPRRPVPRSLVITPDTLDPRLLAQALVSWGGTVDAVLLRFRRWPDRQVYRLAIKLAAIEERPALFMSDRFDLALAAGLEGVHLREASLPPDSVRAAAPDLCIGVSRHDAAGLAASEDADYAILGPVFPTGSKPGHGGMGLAVFRSLSESSPIPTLALGGISRQRVPECLAAGAHGVAVLSAVWATRNPVEAGLAFGELLSEEPF
jgi:thiamine-phosphate diphosphorylase